MKARDAFDRYHAHVRAYDTDKVVESFAEDGRWELPFTPNGFPSALTGRDEIRAFIAPMYDQARASGRRITGYDQYVVHETADPEVIVSEFTVRGEIPATGASYERTFIQVARIRDGKILLLRDYFDSAAMAALVSPRR